jgi:GT2 family glycosyltransferase
MHIFFSKEGAIYFMNNHKYEPLVSIVILNWNRCEDVLETLEGVKKLLYDNLEVIVVDNGSTDKSLSSLKNYKSNIKLISLPANIGCEDGNNVGILNANGEIILFLDSDAGIEINGISKIIKSFEDDPCVGIVEPKIIRPSDNKVLNEPENWPIRNTFTGCVVAIKADVFRKIGLRPGEFFIYSSEPDICLRAIEAGFKIIHRSDIIGEHREAATSRISKQYYFYATRNFIWLIWRHYPLKSALYETIILLTIQLIGSVRHFAIHYYLQGIIYGLFGLRKQALSLRKPLKRYADARVFPGFKDLIKILIKKIFKGRI